MMVRYFILMQLKRKRLLRTLILSRVNIVIIRFMQGIKENLRNIYEAIRVKLTYQFIISFIKFKLCFFMC